MERYSTVIVRGLVLALLLCAQPVSLAADPAFEIEFSDNRVTIDTDGASLEPLLRALANEAGFSLSLPAEMPLLAASPRVTDLPLKDALQKLLRGISHALVYDEASATVKALYILPTGAEQTPAELLISADGANLQQQLSALQSGELALRLGEALGGLQDPANRDVLQAPRQTPPPQDHSAVINQIMQSLQQLQTTLPEIGQPLENAAETN